MHMRVLLPRVAFVTLAIAVVAGCGSGSGGSTLSMTALMDPLTCQNCHSAQYQEWSGSMHAIDGEPVAPGVEGAICLRLPLPPGGLPTLWNDDERYVASYLSAYPGWYLTGDGGYTDEDGYVYVMGRTDDVINVAGHRLSTGSMEAVLGWIPGLVAHPVETSCCGTSRTIYVGPYASQTHWLALAGMSSSSSPPASPPTSRLT